MSDGIAVTVGDDGSTLSDSTVKFGNVAGGNQVNYAAPPRNQQLDRLEQEFGNFRKVLTGNPWDGSQGLIRDVNDLKKRLVIVILVVVTSFVILYLMLRGITNELTRLNDRMDRIEEQLRKE